MSGEEYLRKPFVVHAVRITEDNIDELAPKIGEVRYKKGSGDPFIQVDEAKLKNIPRVFLGFYMTEMDGKVRCYSPRVFEKQFHPVGPVEQEYLDYFETLSDVDDPEANASVRVQLVIKE